MASNLLPQLLQNEDEATEGGSSIQIKKNKNKKQTYIIFRQSYTESALDKVIHFFCFCYYAQISDHPRPQNLFCMKT